jgi:hypothetical protein
MAVDRTKEAGRKQTESVVSCWTSAGALHQSPSRKEVLKNRNRFDSTECFKNTKKVAWIGVNEADFLAQPVATKATKRINFTLNARSSSSG